MSNLAPKPGAQAASPREINVVVVDDSAPARSMLLRLLAPHLRIRISGQAENGLDGFALAASLRPDLVIADLQMPGLNGLQLVERLRQQFPAMRSLITSVYDSSTCRAASLQHGADAFIGKRRLLEEFPSLLASLFPEAVEPETTTCPE